MAVAGTIAAVASGISAAASVASPIIKGVAASKANKREAEKLREDAEFQERQAEEARAVAEQRAEEDRARAEEAYQMRAAQGKEIQRQTAFDVGNIRREGTRARSGFTATMGASGVGGGSGSVAAVQTDITSQMQRSINRRRQQGDLAYRQHMKGAKMTLEQQLTGLERGVEDVNRRSEAAMYGVNKAREQAGYVDEQQKYITWGTVMETTGAVADAVGGMAAGAVGSGGGSGGSGGSGGASGASGGFSGGAGVNGGAGLRSGSGWWG